MTQKRISNLKHKLQESRSRLIDINPNFSELLLNAVYVADNNVHRVSTNGTCFYFDPDWLQRIGTRELDFILAHQIMHIELGHIYRSMYYKGERFHLACDIIANDYLISYGFAENSFSHIGTIYSKTFFPSVRGSSLTPEEAIKYVPFDPARYSKTQKKYVIDSDQWWDKRNDQGENGVILLCPDDNEDDPEGTGEKYRIRYKRNKKKKKKIILKLDADFDIEVDSCTKLSDVILSLKEIKSAKLPDRISDSNLREWQNNMQRKKLEWRKLLNVFLHENYCDYSFLPPDRRYQNADFFLPDYTVPNIKSPKILFLVDTSLSVEDNFLSVVFSELNSVVSQFSDSFEGVLAFFDSRVYKPEKFMNISDLKMIKPLGGGFTDFSCIFEFVRKEMMSSLPQRIVIFTDGKGEIPNKEASMNIPVLWIMNNSCNIPKWGEFIAVEE